VFKLRAVMNQIGVLVAVAYSGVAMMPCTPVGAVPVTPAPHHDHAAASTEALGHEPVAPGEAHFPASARHTEHPETTSLLAFCACGCDAPGGAESKTRTQSNALKAPEPTWLPPAGEARFPESQVLSLAEPLRKIDTVPISSC
jgi:hypothetical protein